MNNNSDSSDLSLSLSPLVSDLSLADLCRELQYQSDDTYYSDEREIEREREKSIESEFENVKDDRKKERERVREREQEEAKERREEEGVEEEEEEEEEGENNMISLAEFRRQSDELTVYLESLKQGTLLKERQEEEYQHQSIQEEKSAVYFELDNMVDYINNVKTAFISESADKSSKKHQSDLGIESKLVGKGKYAKITKTKLIEGEGREGEGEGRGERRVREGEGRGERRGGEGKGGVQLNGQNLKNKSSNRHSSVRSARDEENEDQEEEDKDEIREQQRHKQDRNNTVEHTSDEEEDDHIQFKRTDNESSDSDSESYRAPRRLKGANGNHKISNRNITSTDPNQSSPALGSRTSQPSNSSPNFWGSLFSCTSE